MQGEGRRASGDKAEREVGDEKSGVLLKRSRYGLWQRRFFSTKGKHLRYQMTEGDAAILKKINVCSYESVDANGREIQLQRWRRRTGTLRITRLRARTVADAAAWAAFLAHRAEVSAVEKCLLLPKKERDLQQDEKDASSHDDDDDDEVAAAADELPPRHHHRRKNGKTKGQPLLPHVVESVFEQVASSSSDTSETADRSTADEEVSTDDVARMEQLLLKERLARGLKASRTPPAAKKPPPPSAWHAPLTDGPPFADGEDVGEEESPVAYQVEVQRSRERSRSPPNDATVIVAKAARDEIVTKKRCSFDPEVGRRELLEIAAAKPTVLAPMASFLTEPSRLGHVWLPQWRRPSKPSVAVNALLYELCRALPPDARLTPAAVARVFHASPMLLGLQVEYCEAEHALEEATTLADWFSNASRVASGALGLSRTYADGDGDGFDAREDGDDFDAREPASPSSVLSSTSGPKSIVLDIANEPSSYETNANVTTPSRARVLRDRRLPTDLHPNNCPVS